ncbi:MAG: tetratricopeptide repeat protein [Bdellovibrionota bacterium]
MKLAYILGEFDEFNRIAKFVLRKQPDNEEVKLLLAYQAISNGRSYLADFYTSKLRSPTLASQILNLRGLISFQKGNGIEALGILKQGLKKDKKNYALGMNLGIIYLHYKMFKAAEKHFTSMTRTFSNGYDAQLHLAIAYAAQKKLDKAKGIVANLLELFPSSSILKRMIKKVDK